MVPLRIGPDVDVPTWRGWSFAVRLGLVYMSPILRMD